MTSFGPAVLTRVQALLDAAERPAVALDREARIVASNRAASTPGGSSTAATFAELIAACASELSGPCADVDRELQALDLDIPSRVRSVDGRQRVRVVPFADGLLIAISRFATDMAELDPMIVRSEIHDGLSQDLSALGFAACALRMRIAELDDPVLAELSERVEALADTASSTVRALYRHFERGATGGLLDALAAMGAELEEATGTQLWIRVEDRLDRGPAPIVREQLVAMARAAVLGLAATNGARVWLGLAAYDGRARIEIRAAEPIDRLDPELHAALDDHAEAIGATWTHAGAAIAIVV